MFNALSFFLLMQLNKQLLSSDDVTGLIKKYSLSACTPLRSIRANISRSRYRYRCHTCNLMVISPRKLSNNPLKLMIRIVRFVMF